MPAPVASESDTVQLCQRCGRFVATLMVTADRFLLCEACALEAGVRERAIPVQQFSKASDCVHIERDWIARIAPQLGTGELRLYLWLAASEGPHTRSALSRDLNLSPSALKRAARTLRDRGLVHPIECGQSGTRYLTVRAVADGDRPALVCPEIYDRAPTQTAANPANPEQRGGASGEPPQASRGASGGPPFGVGGPSGEPPSARSVDPGSGGVLISTKCVGVRPYRLTPTHLDCVGSQAAPDPAVPTDPPLASPPWTHPPSPDSSSSPVGSRSVDHSEASSPVGSRSHSEGSSPAGEPQTVDDAWPTYARHVIRDVRRDLLLVAKAAGVTATEAQVDAFLIQGAREDWIRKQTVRGKLNSPLHAWGTAKRWFGWLRRESDRTQAESRVRDMESARRERFEVRRQKATEAIEQAKLRQPDLPRASRRRSFVSSAEAREAAELARTRCPDLFPKKASG